MSVGVVVIGRNEGARLVRCLASLAGTADRTVYVDSGSTDGSAERARDAGAEVVLLDTSAPFTAARGRNAGFAALEKGQQVETVQFVDGDCTVEPGWISKAAAALAADAALGVVTGWRQEIAPGASVYNGMFDVEWHGPVGPIRACGGDMMVRAEAFRKAGGFDAGIIASEDEEFVLRVTGAGYAARRLPEVMTHHDAAMTRIGQWWRRNVRTGHGFAEVGRLHPEHFRAERARVWAYLAIVLAALASMLVLPVWVSLAGLVAFFAVSWARIARYLRGTGLGIREAAHHAAFYTLAKLPHLQGMLTYHLRRLRGSARTIIEYK